MASESPTSKKRKVLQPTIKCFMNLKPPKSENAEAVPDAKPSMGRSRCGPRVKQQKGVFRDQPPILRLSEASRCSDRMREDRRMMQLARFFLLLSAFASSLTLGYARSVGNSTKQGYVCPFVDCPVCQPPCQHKNITKYKTGVYEGCVENETCSGVLFTLEMTPFEQEQCVGPCKVIKEAEAVGKEQGCLRQVCSNAPCPIYPTPSPSPCEEEYVVHDDCGCPYKILRNKTSDKCDVKCQTLIEEGETCTINCVFKDSRICNKYCETKEISGEVDNATCTQPVTCVPRTCAEIGETEGKCLFSNTDKTRFSDDPKCKCGSNEDEQFVKHSCSHCEEKMCKEKCPDVTRNCEDYQQSAPVVCSSEFNKTCSKYCQESLQCLCEATSKCPNGFDRVLVNCQMTDAQCNKDPKCCGKLCLIDNGKRKQHTCKLKKVPAQQESRMQRDGPPPGLKPEKPDKSPSGVKPGKPDKSPPSVVSGNPDKDDAEPPGPGGGGGGGGAGGEAGGGGGAGGGGTTELFLIMIISVMSISD